MGAWFAFYIFNEAIINMSSFQEILLYSVLVV